MGRTARQILSNILPFATSLALVRGFFRQFGLTVVAADEDRADARRLNVILWKDAMGPKPVPWMILHPHRAARHDMDD